MTPVALDLYKARDRCDCSSEYFLTRMKAGGLPRDRIMARVCSVSGKKPHFGNNVSHANNKTRRRWQPNLQICSFPSEILGKAISLRLTANGIRTVEHNGGIDAFLLTTRNSHLTDTALRLKKRLVKIQDGKKKA